MLRDMSAVRAGANGIGFSWSMGDGIMSSSGCDACGCGYVASQKGLLMMLLPRSIRSSISTLHSAGLNKPPNVSRR